MPFPETLNTNPRPRIIFFTDFDGTITLTDCNDLVTDHYGFGAAERAAAMRRMLDEIDNFRTGFLRMIDSWKVSLPDMISFLKNNVNLDPHFRSFVLWAREHQVPVIVLSSGFIPVIRALLSHHLGPDLASYLEIIANEPKLHAPISSFDKPQGWTIQYHDDSGFGHDKSLTIRQYARAIAQLPVPDNEKPTLLYAGDGVSDLSAARETDLLFAKAGKDLVTYCEREGLPFTEFDDWSSILEETREIYEGEEECEECCGRGFDEA